MELVKPETLSSFVERFLRAVEVDNNEATFVMAGGDMGPYVLTGRSALIWTGMLNSTARWTCNGASWPSVTDACNLAFRQELDLYYSDNASLRLRWIADAIDELRLNALGANGRHAADSKA